jgi:formamidopyrimidine-DNA glycosylase
MPELPDLQVFARNLSKLFKGETLSKIKVTVPKKLNVPETKLQSALEGEILTDIERVGKELQLKFKNDHVLALHMMLHGELKLFDQTNEHKFTIIELHFKNGKGLALTDFQNAATPTLDPEVSGVPDALAIDFTELRDKLAAKHSPVKTVLMDQKVIRGIGNAYADEVLYDAAISPFSVSNKIPEAKVKILLKSIVSVLKDAEERILKERPGIVGGEVRDFLKVHQPKKKETDAGEPILQKPVGSRKTYYTDKQVLY